MKALLSAWLLAGLLSAEARAGGFQIFEHGARSTGMANARSALADDVSALYFNPAAVAELPGLQVELGVTGILPLVHYQAAGRAERPRTYPSYRDGAYVFDRVNDGERSVDAKRRGFSPIHLFAAYRLDSLGLSVGYALCNPFGLGTYWPGDWDGRFIATETEIQSFLHQPTVVADLAAWAGFEDALKLSVAVGYNLAHATARLGRKIDLRAAEAISKGEVLGAEGELLMQGSGLGHGFNAALYAELPGLLAFGFSLRSGIRLPFSGEARFGLNSLGQQAAELLGLTVPQRSDAEVVVDLPWNLNFGLAFLGIADWTIALDAYAAFFSSYDQLELKFACVEEGTCSEALNAGPIPKHWGTAWQLCLGAEHRVAERLALRAGYGLVVSPVPEETYDPALPDGLRQLFSLGAGYRGDWWAVDLGYMLAFWEGEKDNDVGAGDNHNPEGKANGRYATVTHVLALSLSAHF